MDEAPSMGSVPSGILHPVGFETSGARSMVMTMTMRRGHEGAHGTSSSWLRTQGPNLLVAKHE